MFFGEGMLKGEMLESWADDQQYDNWGTPLPTASAVCMYICVNMYIMYVRVYVVRCVHVCNQQYDNWGEPLPTASAVYTYMRCIHLCVSIHTYVYIYICIYICIYLYIYAYIYVQLNEFVHTYVTLE